jgi:hypothetical protein
MVGQIALADGLEPLDGGEHARGVGRVLGMVEGQEVRGPRREQDSVPGYGGSTRAQRVTRIDQPSPLVRSHALAKP